MKRVVIVMLAIALLPTGFVIGYFTRPILRPQGSDATGSAAPTVAAASSPTPTPAAPASSPAADEPRFKLVEEEGSALKNILGAERIWRYQGGLPQIHVQYFVDYVEGGVKKRAILQAFNVGPARGLGAFPQWHCDVKKSDGVIALNEQGLRTVHQFVAAGPPDKKFAKRNTFGVLPGGPFTTTWDVLDCERRVSKGPKESLVLDFDKVEKDPPRFPCYPFWSPHFGGARGAVGWMAFGSDERFTFHLWTESRTYAGQFGYACLLVVIVDPSPQAPKVPATVEACDAEVARLRNELAANPEHAQRKWDLAWAIDFGRALRRKGSPKAYPADSPDDETLRLVREVTKQVPANMYYRAELRRLLFRQASSASEQTFVLTFPGLLAEILSLVPLDNSEHLEAAQLLLRWKHAKLKKDLPEDEKKRIVQETDAQVVRLLRRHAEVWQNHPEEIQKKLQAYEKDAAGQSYAETPEFGELLKQMREWAKQG
jgi:hypothetical protein